MHSASRLLSSSTEQHQQQLSAAALKQQTGEFDLSTATRLELRHVGLSQLSGGALGECVGLTQLDLSGNRLASLDGAVLEPLVLLRRLVLTSNRFERLGSLTCVSTTLQHLQLEDNLICELTELAHLQHFVNLSRLALQDASGGLTNRVCQRPGYRETVLRHFGAGLRQLDGLYLGPAHVQLAQLHTTLAGAPSSAAGASSVVGVGRWSEELSDLGRPQPALDLAAPHAADLNAALTECRQLVHRADVVLRDAADETRRHEQQQPAE